MFLHYRNVLGTSIHFSGTLYIECMLQTTNFHIFQQCLRVYGHHTKQAMKCNNQHS